MKTTSNTKTPTILRTPRRAKRLISGKAGRRALGVPAPTINNILAVTCPACQVGNGAICDSSFGGTYKATSRGLLHPEREKAAGLVVNTFETVTPYTAPGSPQPALASVSFGAANLFANNDSLVVPDGVGGSVLLDVQVDGAYTPASPLAVTVDLRPIFPSGTPENVASIFDAAIVANTALDTSASAGSVEWLAWPIPGVVGNGNVVTATAANPLAMTAENFSGGSGTSTLAYARGSLTVLAGVASFANHDTLTIDTDVGSLVLEFKAVALGFVPTPGDVTVDITAAPTAADVAAAIDAALFANSDFFLEPSGHSREWCGRSPAWSATATRSWRLRRRPA
jgi:hypothetical protein